MRRYQGWRAYQLTIQRLDVAQRRSRSYTVATIALLFVTSTAFACVVLNLLSSAP